jgi:hypothetical protein
VIDMEKLTAKLESEFGAHLSDQFVLGAFYDATMDFLEYSKEDTVTVSERVDGVLTLLRDGQSREVIGFRLKGFRYIFNKLKPTLQLRDEQFLVLIKAIEAAVTLMGDEFVGDSNRLAKYKLAHALAERDGARFSDLGQMDRLVA